MSWTGDPMQGIGSRCLFSDADDWPAPAVVPSPDWTFVSGDTPFYTDADIAPQSFDVDNKRMWDAVRSFADFFVTTRPDAFKALFS